MASLDTPAGTITYLSLFPYLESSGVDTKSTTVTISYSVCECYKLQDFSYTLGLQSTVYIYIELCVHVVTVKLEVGHQHALPAPSDSLIVEVSRNHQQ